MGVDVVLHQVSQRGTSSKGRCAEGPSLEIHLDGD
jgi:hypothetical protein